MKDLSELIGRRRGRWELSKNHELTYRAEGKDEFFRFKGSLVAAEPKALVVSWTEQQSDQNRVTRLAKLSGQWSVNASNQIEFQAQKQSGRVNVLKFTGGWRVGKSQELIYTYQTQELKTKRKELRLLVFEGVWDISQKNSLVYLLSGDSASALRFRGAFQSKSILAKKGEIKFQVGADISGRKKVQEVVLFGKWKYSDKAGLFFEMTTKGGRRTAIGFGGNCRLVKDTEIEVELKTSKGSSLGVRVLLNKDIFGKDGQAFMRLERSLEESRIEAGVSVRW